MKDEQRIKALEDEIKVLKNEVKSVLLDVREQYLNIQNPFNMNAIPSAGGLAVGPNPEIQEQRAQQLVQPISTDFGGNAEETLSEPEPRRAEHVPAKEARTAAREERGDNYNSEEFNDMPVSMPAGGNMSMPGGNETGPGSQEVFSSLWQKRNADGAEYDNQSSPGFSACKVEKKKIEGPNVKSEIDLVVIAGLTQWIDQATAKLGKERTEILIEMSFTMGHLPENLKDALVKMARISRNDSADKMATASDYLAILAQLENLLAGSQLRDNALLSILSMIKDTKNG
jgi:hypothetical protein